MSCVCTLARRKKIKMVLRARLRLEENRHPSTSRLAWSILQVAKER